MELTPVLKVREYISAALSYMTLTVEGKKNLKAPKELIGYEGWLYGNARKIMAVEYLSSYGSLSKFFWRLGIHTNNPRVFSDLRCFVRTPEVVYFDGSLIKKDQRDSAYVEAPFIFAPDITAPQMEINLLVACSNCFRVVEQDISLRPQFKDEEERQLFLAYMTKATRCPRCRSLIRVKVREMCKRFIDDGLDYVYEDLYKLISSFSCYRAEIEAKFSYYQCVSCHGLIPTHERSHFSCDKISEHRRRMYSSLVMCRSCVVYRPYQGFDSDIKRCRLKMDSRITQYKSWYDDIVSYSKFDCEFEDIMEKIKSSHVLYYARRFFPGSLYNVFYQLMLDYPHEIRIVTNGFRFGGNDFSFKPFLDMSVEEINALTEEVLFVIRSVISAGKVVRCPMNSYAGSPHKIIIIEDNLPKLSTISEFYSDKKNLGARVISGFTVID